MIPWLAALLIGSVSGTGWTAFLPPPVEVPGAFSFSLEKLFGSPAQSPHPAVVRVVVQERGGMSLGSGALVAVQGNSGLVLTNWHVVRDAAGPITVYFPDGFRSRATVLKVDPEWDLAALAIWRPQVAPIPLAAEMPRLGEPLTIVGYGSGSYRAATGRCLQYLSPGRNEPPEMIELSVAARQGDSGGPILNQQGQLAGVLFGASWGRTAGSSCQRVRTFLEPLSGWFSPLPAESLVAWHQTHPAKTPVSPLSPDQATSETPAPGYLVNRTPFAAPDQTANWTPRPANTGHSPIGTSPWKTPAPPSVPSLAPAHFPSGERPSATTPWTVGSESATSPGSPIFPTVDPPGVHGQPAIPPASLPWSGTPDRKNHQMGPAFPPQGPPSGISQDLAQNPDPSFRGGSWGKPAYPAGETGGAPTSGNSSRFEAIKNFLAFVGAVALLLLAVQIVGGLAGE